MCCLDLSDSKLADVAEARRERDVVSYANARSRVLYYTQCLA